MCCIFTLFLSIRCYKIQHKFILTVVVLFIICLYSKYMEGKNVSVLYQYFTFLLDTGFQVIKK